MVCIRSVCVIILLAVNSQLHTYREVLHAAAKAAAFGIWIVPL